MKKLPLTTGILLAGLLVLAGLACGEEAEEEVEGPPSGWKSYHSDEHSFEIYYPGDWEKFYPAGAIVGFIDPEADEVQGNIQIMIASCGDASLEEYIAANKESILQALPGASISNEKDIEVQGRKGHGRILRWTMEGFNLKQKHVVFVAHRKAYVFGCGALENKYSEYENTFDEVINSIVIE